MAAAHAAAAKGVPQRKQRQVLAVQLMLRMDEEVEADLREEPAVALYVTSFGDAPRGVFFCRCRADAFELRLAELPDDGDAEFFSSLPEGRNRAMAAKPTRAR